MAGIASNFRFWLQNATGPNRRRRHVFFVKFKMPCRSDRLNFAAVSTPYPSPLSRPLARQLIVSGENSVDVFYFY